MFRQFKFTNFLVVAVELRMRSYNFSVTEKAYKAMKKENRVWSAEPVIELVNQFVFNLFDSRDLKQSV